MFLHKKTSSFPRRGITTLALSCLAVALAGCGAVASPAEKNINVIAQANAAYSDPLEIAAELLEEEGYDVETNITQDTQMANQEVATGSYDVNFFQHVAYLTQWNRDNDEDLVGLFYVYAAPGGIWSEHHDSVDQLPEGAQIAIPVDPANNGRALQMLATEGLLELDTDNVTETTQESIVSNPKNFEFIEIENSALARAVSDVDAAFMFTRDAAEIELYKEDAIAFEEDDDALPFRILVAGKKELVGTELAADLQAAFQSEEVDAWFEEYLGGILPRPWDEDPIADAETLEESRNTDDAD